MLVAAVRTFSAICISASVCAFVYKHSNSTANQDMATKLDTEADLGHISSSYVLEVKSSQYKVTWSNSKNIKISFGVQGLLAWVCM